MHPTIASDRNNNWSFQVCQTKNVLYYESIVSRAFWPPTNQRNIFINITNRIMCEILHAEELEA